MYFILSLMLIQALSITGGFTFDSILPYMILLITISLWQEKIQIEKKAVLISSLFSVVYMVIYILRENSIFKGTIVFAGGFLAISFIWHRIKTLILDKYTIIISSVFMVIVIINLIQEKFIILDDLGFISGISLILFLGILHLGLYNILSGLLKHKKVSVYSFFGAILFALFSKFGHISVFEGKLIGYEATSPFILSVLIAFLCWTILFYMCFEEFYKIINRITLTYGGEQRKGICIRPLLCGGISFLIIVLCYIPFFLRYYPGIIEYDSWMQMVQVLGAPYSNHHPWLHTMIIKAIYELGILIFHSENRAIALYSCFSISLLAFAFSCVIAYLYTKKVKLKFLVFLVAVYALSPINGIYSVIMWKDIPFAAVCLLFLLQLAYMKDKSDQEEMGKVNYLLFILLSFLVCFLRSNGLYAYLLLVPFIIYTFRNKKMNMFISIGVVFLFAFIYKGPVFNHFGVTEPDTIESLSIPAQQIAAVIAYDGNVTEEQKELLEDIVSLEELPAAYLGSVHCSDSVKDLVRLKGRQEQIDNNKMIYLNLWLQMGLQNKYIYLKAFIDETSGYWYHKITYPFIWVTYVMENGSGITRECKLPPVYEQKISDYMENYKEHFWKYYSNGLFVYLLFLCLITAMRNKSKHLVIYLWNIGIWLTLIVATPVYADFRYAYAIFLAIPFLIFVTIVDSQGEQIKIG